MQRLSTESVAASAAQGEQLITVGNRYLAFRALLCLIYLFDISVYGHHGVSVIDRFVTQKALGADFVHDVTSSNLMIWLRWIRPPVFDTQAPKFAGKPDPRSFAEGNFKIFR
jgi:hypothetical protein